jgi:catechol 2,3-dioxygenase-like lactoylglutathione lyase family enzyme
MRIHHIALISGSEVKADRFYGELLGLEKIRSSTIESALSRGLFGFDRSFRALMYRKDDVSFEVFVVEEPVEIRPRLCHVAIEVDNQAQFLETCRTMVVQIIQVPKEERMVTMIQDFDGNLFELKEKI